MTTSNPLWKTIAAATPLPWKADAHRIYLFAEDGMVADRGSDYDKEQPPGVIARIRGFGAQLPQTANMELLEAAVNVLPKHLTEIDRLTKELHSDVAFLNDQQNHITALEAELAEAKSLFRDVFKLDKLDGHVYCDVARVIARMDDLVAIIKVTKEN